MRCYPYECNCGNKWDVYKNLSEIDRVEVCPVCQAFCDSSSRKISRRQQIFGTAVEDATFCPVMGQVVKSNSHRRQLAKARGMIEVGNDYKDGLQMHDTMQRDLEKQIDKSWEKV